MWGGRREGAGRKKNSKKEPTVSYYRRIKPQWVAILDKKLEKLKGLEEMKNLTKEDIIGLMIDYISNSYVDFEVFGELEEDIQEIFGRYERAFHALPVD
ncbi:hypothetical protein IJ531_02295 [bacterium]|nr:hypothetical protein [bacterium]